jgi:hypothetical protein
MSDVRPACEEKTSKHKGLGDSMTLPLEFPADTRFDWFDHDQADCPSLAGFCDHCIECGAVVERYTVTGLPTCDAHYQKASVQ